MSDRPRLNEESLYALVPAVYRARDAKAGEPLKALVNVLAGQGGLVEADIRGLLENWFIETCDEWVVPYIGDLLGVRGLRDVRDSAAFTRRALVANTTGYRRRKGTAAALEQLAFDATGWRAKAVEFFAHLEATQYMNHVRADAHRTPRLADAGALELVGSAFDPLPRTVDVRGIESGRGRYNIPNVGILLWRLQSFRRERALLRAASVPHRFHVHPLANDAPLFNPPRTEARLTDPTLEPNVPVPLRRRPLHDELEARRQALVDGDERRYGYFDDRPDARALQAFELILDGVRVPPDRLAICDLADWHQPADTRIYERRNPDGTVIAVPMPLTAAVDPLLGRICLAPAAVGATVEFGYSYGFPGDIGAGTYDRSARLPLAAEAGDPPVAWQAGVSRTLAPVPGEIYASLGEAVDQWNGQPPGTVGVIVVMDNATFDEALMGTRTIEIPERSHLVITAGGWPARQIPDAPPGSLAREVGDWSPGGVLAHVTGDIDVLGTAPPNSPSAGKLSLDGLLLEGRLRVRTGWLGALSIAHSTLSPATSLVRVVDDNHDLRIAIARCVCGPIDTEPAIDALEIEDSVVQGAPDAILARRSPLMVCAATVLGRVRSRRLNATNAIFTEEVDVALRQEGCVRFSYVPGGSSTPRRYRCQPDLAIATSPGDESEIRARMTPVFTSVAFTDAGFAQLHVLCAAELRTGAEGGAEMGAWQFLMQPQRIGNLEASLGTYLRFGLEAGLFFET